MDDAARAAGSVAKFSGRVLSDRYLLVERLGGGAMGEVYRGRHTLMDKEVAIKVLHRDLTRSGEAVARFQREARAAAQIEHPNVCSATDFGQTDEGSFFLVMQFLEGMPLSRLIFDKGRVPVKRALRIVRQVCEGLQAAHDAGVIHRDLKPDNIMLVEREGERDFVKILDFGVAVILAREDKPERKITRAGVVYGTAEYMAPEQAAGARVDGRADLYALGVILFEMLTGKLPFDSAVGQELLVKHINEEPPTIAEVAPEADFPPEVTLLVDQLLSKRRDRRPQSAAELIERVDELLQMLTLRERPIQRLLSQIARGATKGERDDASTGLKIVLFAVATIATVALLAVLLFDGGDSPPQPGPSTSAQALSEMTSAGVPSALGSPSRDPGGANGAAPVDFTGEREAFLRRDDVRAARASVTAGNPKQAVMNLGAISEKEPDNGHAFYELGRAQVESGVWPDALSAFDGALQADPRYRDFAPLLDLLFGRFESPSTEEAKGAGALLTKHAGGQMLERLERLARDDPRPAVRRRAYQALEQADKLERLQAWSRLSIQLRAAPQCEQRRALLAAMVELGDARVMPTLEVFRMSRSGCGPDGQTDCHACMRAELAQAMKTLAAEPPQDP